jgi:hypothetical protein
MVDAVVHAEDVLPVRSRVSWGAIFAGSMVALALYFLLTLLGGAIGLSVSDKVRSGTLATAAAVWTIVVTALSLFVGGYVTSQCTAGENKFEAVIYGVITWGVLFAMLMWLMASGVRSGFNALVSLAHVNQATAGDSSRDWEGAARQAGVPQKQIDDWKGKANDPQARQELADTATTVTWWAFLGTFLSMLASVAGAWLGAGPTLRLLAVRVPRRTVESRQPVGRM